METPTPSPEPMAPMQSPQPAPMAPSQSPVMSAPQKKGMKPLISLLVAVAVLVVAYAVYAYVAGTWPFASVPAVPIY